MVKGLAQLRKLLESAPDIVREEMRRAAREMAEEQERLIESGRAPGGGPQKKNAPAYARRKKGLPPLEKTGRLKDAGAWRVEQVGDGYRLSPPSDRIDAVKRLRARGFEFVFDKIPPGFVERVQARVIAAIKRGGRG